VIKNHLICSIKGNKYWGIYPNIRGLNKCTEAQTQWNEWMHTVPKGIGVSTGTCCYAITGGQ